MARHHPIDCLLINPPDDFSQYPYLGLCSLAGSLREAGIQVEILDSAALGLTINQVIENIQRKQPRIIGISIMSMMLRICFELIRAIRENYPQVEIVIGGAHVDADPSILKAMEIRYGFRGECEAQLVSLCRRIIDNSEVEPDSMPGLITNVKNRLFVQQAPMVDNLDLLPRPAYELLPHDRYFSPSSSLKTISLITSRGCPYNCTFCSKLQQKRYRSLSSKRIMEDLDVLVKRLGFQWIEFVDEIFTLNRNRIIDLCQSIKKEKFNFSWGMGTRVDRIDEELIQLMREAGCRKIGFGIESGVERVRHSINKKISDSQIRDAVRLCRKYRLKVQAGFILGHPGESLAEMKQTISFARKLKINYPNFNKMMIIPNSEVFEVAKREKKVSDDIWADYMTGKSAYPVYTPAGVQPGRISKLFHRAWLSNYLLPSAWWRNRSLLLKPRFLLRGIRAFRESASEKRYR